MYFYYMLSAMGPQYQKYLWWKKWMTEIQIVSNRLDVLHLRRSSVYEEKSVSLGIRKKSHQWNDIENHHHLSHFRCGNNIFLRVLN